MKSFFVQRVVLFLSLFVVAASAFSQDFAVVTSSEGFLQNEEGEVEKTVSYLTVLDAVDADRQSITLDDGLKIRRSQVHYSADFDYLSENLAGARQAYQTLWAANDEQLESSTANEKMNQAIEQIQSAFKKKTPAIAWFQSVLAYRYYEQGDFQRANEILDSAKSLVDEIGASRHVQVADVLNVRALVRIEESEIEEAIGLLKESLRMQRSDLGDEHLDLAAIRENLSYAYDAMGETENAVRAQQLAVQSRKEQLPPMAFVIPHSIKSLGERFFANDQFQEAVDCYQEAIAMLDEFHSDLPTESADARLRIGDSYELLERFDRADESYRSVAKDLPRMTSENANAYQKIIHHRQGLLDYGRERYDDAIAHYLDAAKLLQQQALAFEDGETWENIGQAYAAQDQNSQAKEAYVKAIRIYASIYGNDYGDLSRVDGLIRDLDGARDGSLDDVIMVSPFNAYMFDDDDNYLTSVPKFTVLSWNGRTDETEASYAFYTAPHNQSFGNIDVTQLRTARMLPGYFEASANDFQAVVRRVNAAESALNQGDSTTASQELDAAVKYCKKYVGEGSTLTLWVQMFQIRLLASTEGPEAASETLAALDEKVQAREPGDYPIEMDSHLVAGELMMLMAKPKIAVEEFQAARDIAVEHLGSFHSDVLDLSRKLAQAFLESGQVAEAADELRRSLEIAHEIFPHDVVEVDETKRALSLVLRQIDAAVAPQPPMNQASSAADDGQRRLTDKQQEELFKTKELNRKLWGFFDAGKIEQAIPPARKVVEIREKVLGEHPSTAESLNNLGYFLKETKQYDSAESTFKRALEVRESVLGAEHPDTILSINELAQLYDVQDRFAEAKKWFQRLLDVRVKALGAQHPDVATTLNSLAFQTQMQGDYAEAAKLYERAVAIRTNSLGADHPDTAVSIEKLAGVHVELGDLMNAVGLYQRAIEINKKSFGLDHQVTAACLNNLAKAYQAIGDFSKAEALFMRSNQILEKLLGADHVEFAKGLNNLGLLYIDMGKLAAAEPLLQQAFNVVEGKYGPRDLTTAQCSNNLALLSTKQGDFAAAEAMYRSSLKIREQVVGSDHLLTAASVNNLAHLMYRRREMADAEHLFRRALEIRKQTLGTDHPDTANSLDALATILADQSRYDESLQMYESALKIRQETSGQRHPSTASTLNNLAALKLKSGDSISAEKYFRRSLSIREEALGPNHPDTVNSLRNLGILKAANGETEQASQLIDQAQRGMRFHVAKHLPYLAEPQQEMFLASDHSNGFEAALSFGLANSDDQAIVSLSAGWITNGKAVAQEALTQRNRLSHDRRSPELAATIEQLQSVRTHLAKLAMSQVDSTRLVEKRRTMERLAAEEAQLSRQLAAKGAKGDSVKWIEHTQVQKALSTRTALIDIARFDVFDFSAKDKNRRWMSPRYAAWITRGGDQVNSVLVDLGDADEIDALVDKVRRSISSSGDQIESLGQEKATALLREELENLKQRIWDPLEPELGGIADVLLSPDGGLWLAPWNSLPIENNEFLIEKYTLRMVISSRDIVRKPTAFATLAPVMIANPDFDQVYQEKSSSIEAIFQEMTPADETTIRSFSAKSVVGDAEQLPYTALEAIAIEPSMERYIGKKPILYKEEFALERVVKALHRPSVATFATHGFFLPKQSSDKNELRPTASSESIAPALDSNAELIENPLLRCGLLLAGCNDRKSVVGDDDGILTGLEIVGIDFRGTKLVVLSACDTGVGDVRIGEGVAGLRQAFQLAGAQSVVSTLWQVPDRDSAQIMAAFFGNLADGQLQSESLRNAQLQTIDSRRQRFGAAHPIFWGAWNITGTGQ